MALLALFAFHDVLAGELRPLQPLIDAAEPNDVLLLEPGVYQGPVEIDKRLTLDGGGKATIDAGGKGSVVYLETDGASLRNLRLINSGDSHNDIDAGVQIVAILQQQGFAHPRFKIKVTSQQAASELARDQQLVIRLGSLTT